LADYKTNLKSVVLEGFFRLLCDVSRDTNACFSAGTLQNRHQRITSSV